MDHEPKTVINGYFNYVSYVGRLLVAVSFEYGILLRDIGLGARADLLGQDGAG